MIKDTIKIVSNKKDLNAEQMSEVFEEIMCGAASKEEMKTFLLALKDKGESPDEIAAAAGIMREKATKVITSIDNLIDTCGTGGALIHDINVSTIVAFIMAGCGVKVAKHGNRSFTGRCGSADILEALGVNINTTPEKVAYLIENVGIGFIFAKNFHPAMKNVMEARKELKTRTIFNILGPLSNPAGANQQILGVFDPGLTEIIAKSLKRLGSSNAIVVHGMEGLDEISIKGRTKITELDTDGSIRTSMVSPEDFGLKEGDIDDIRGGDVNYNKGKVLDILQGRDNSPRRDMVLMNAAAGLKMLGKVPDYKSGVTMAAECIDSGRAYAKLKLLIEMSNG